MKKTGTILMVIFLTACSSGPDRRFEPPAVNKQKRGVETPKQVADKRKIDSLKAIRKKEISSGVFSAKREAIISDSIVKLQIEYDSIENAK